jgi:hypothetical protein
MATRDLTAGMTAAVQAGTIRPAILYEGEFDDGAGGSAFVRLWSGIGTLSWNGQSWLGAGNLLGIGEINESTALRANAFEVWLTGVSSSLIAIALTAARKNRSGKLWLALFNPVAYLSLPGVSGNYASTSDTVANSVTGDLDCIVDVAADDWAPAVNMVLMAKWIDAVNRSFIFRINVGGALGLVYSRDGAETLSVTSTVVTGFGAGVRRYGRFTRAAASGDVFFYMSTDKIIWTQLGAMRPSSAGGLFDNSSELRVGAYSSGVGFWHLAGKVYAAEMRNGINGPVVASFDPLRYGTGALTAQMITGETWTIAQSGGTPAVIVRADDVMIADPYLLKRGRFDTIPIDDSGATSRITVRYEDRLAALGIPRERRYTTADQALRAPGDRGFEYVEALQDATFVLP